MTTSEPGSAYRTAFASRFDTALRNSPGSKRALARPQLAMAHRRAAERPRQIARGPSEDATAQAGTSQGQHPRKGRASVSRDQAPVRTAEGAVSWTAEEHRPRADAVRTVESVDGTQAVDGHAGSPSESSVRAESALEINSERPRYDQSRSPLRFALDQAARHSGLFRPSFRGNRSGARLRS